MAIKRHFSGIPAQRVQLDSDTSDDESTIQPAQLQTNKKEQAEPQHKRSSTIETLGSTQSVETKTTKNGAAFGDNHSDPGDQTSAENSDGSEESYVSDTNSDSDSDGPLIALTKPVFLGNAIKQKVEKGTTTDNERVLKNLKDFKDIYDENRRLRKAQTSKLGGVDDTDDLDPSEELRLFELRKAARDKRDRLRLEQEQEELEELEIRRLRTDDELHEESKLYQNKEENHADYHSKGAFFHNESLRNRKLKGDIERYDKSLLPQRYNPTSK